MYKYAQGIFVKHFPLFFPALRFQVHGECAAKASDACSPDVSSNDGATARGACLRRFCVLVRNYMVWTRFLSVVLRGLGCIWGTLVCFLFDFCIFGMPEDS